MKLDKTISAVITGGASGLGAATARLLASHGVRVAVFDLNEDLGQALAKDLGGVFCKVNVTSSAEVEAGLVQARAAHGQERVLVNCAGVGGSVKTVSRDKQTRAITGDRFGDVSVVLLAVLWARTAWVSEPRGGRPAPVRPRRR